MNEQQADYVPGARGVPPEGEFNCRVQVALDEIGEAKYLCANWVFTVAEGETEGRKIYDRNIIDEDPKFKVSAQILRGRIEDLGYEWPEKIEDLEAVLEEISAAPPLVVVRNKNKTSKGRDGNEYTNAQPRIIDVLESSGPNFGAAAEAEAAPEATAAAEDPELTGLLALCGSYGLQYIDDSMSKDEIVAKLHSEGATFKPADLQPEEKELLEAIDATLIEKKAPPPPPRRTVSTPAKKPAAPAKKGKR
jgi:hypothetical protein